MGENKTSIPASSINTAGGAYIGGSVNTGGGKFVGRDDLDMSVSEGATRADFDRLLGEFRGVLARVALPERQAHVIEGDVNTVQAEVAQAKPDAAIIQSKIDGIAGILGKIGAATERADGSLDKLISLGTKLGILAARVFGG